VARAWISPSSITRWPVCRQVTGPDRRGRGEAAKSAGSEGLTARSRFAHKVVKSACPYCELWFAYHLGHLIRSKLAGACELAGTADEMDRPVLDQRRADHAPFGGVPSEGAIPPA
jgi:hypothetical protein